MPSLPLTKQSPGSVQKEEKEVTTPLGMIQEKRMVNSSFPLVTARSLTSSTLEFDRERRLYQILALVCPIVSVPKD